MPDLVVLILDCLDGLCKLWQPRVFVKIGKTAPKRRVTPTLRRPLWDLALLS